MLNAIDTKLPLFFLRRLLQFCSGTLSVPSRDWKGTTAHGSLAIQIGKGLHVLLVLILLLSERELRVDRGQCRASSSFLSAMMCLLLRNSRGAEKARGKPFFKRSLRGMQRRRSRRGEREVGSGELELAVRTYIHVLISVVCEPRQWRSIL